MGVEIPEKPIQPTLNRPQLGPLVDDIALYSALGADRVKHGQRIQ